MAQVQTNNTTGTTGTLSGNAEHKLAESFNKQSNISNVNTTYQQGVQPPITTGYPQSSVGRVHRHKSSKHPFDRPSVFDTDSAFKKHQEARRSAQTSTTTGTTGVTSQVNKVEQVVLSEEERKVAKEQEKVELLKFEAVRNEVNELIASQNWNQMEMTHVHGLGTRLRQLEQKFWDLKPIAEQLVLKGRNKLAERVDLAEEELLHAILVVSQIYRNRVMDAAHARFPGKIHPKYLERDHELALRHAHRQAQYYEPHPAAQHEYYSRQRGGFYAPAGHQAGYQAGYHGAHQRQQPYIGHGHPGHFGYDADESYGAVPYHGHPHQGYGGYY